MEFPAWIDGINVAITVCDLAGTIVSMNDKAVRTFAAEGGLSLLGKNLMDCHPAAARKKIKRLMATGSSNSYTIEKNGVKKLIHQTPWFENGKRSGLVEFSLVIPAALPHFVRS